MLPQRPLGTTGLHVSALGLGTVKFGRNQGVKYPQHFVLPDDASLRNLLALAKDLGINTLDTAPAYGRSEERLGQLLSHRHDWVIVDKTGETFSEGQSHFDFSPAGLRYSLDNSLRQLRTDYIDVLLLHSDGSDLAIIEQGGLDTLLRFKQEGKVRAIGMSTKTLEGALACLEYADVVMLTYHPEHTIESPALEQCINLHKGAFIKKALASGHLGSDAAKVARENLQFVYQHPGTSCIIVGTLQAEHLRQNVQALTYPANNLA
ncbi:MAG: aldo/keto reductase [Pseudomonadales bacterium]|nr:aldo/keto reductase [Pseudomonadales bacterium]